MGQNFDNRIRAFADVVTIDAWHKPFDGVHEADLHADVVFGTGRIGGEANSQVTFRLNIRRAEIIVILPETEPVAINRASVSRDTPEIEQKLTRTFEQGKKNKFQLKAGLSIGKGSDASTSGGASLEKDTSVIQRLEIATTNRILVTQSKSPDGHYRWIAEEPAGGALQGRPWEASDRRMALVDTRHDRTKGIAPTVRLEVRCRREDLLINDIAIKDPSTWEHVKGKMGLNNRLAAAESYIRDQLTEIGLEVGDIEDRFGHLTMASVTADPS